MTLKYSKEFNFLREKLIFKRYKIPLVTIPSIIEGLPYQSIFYFSKSVENSFSFVGSVGILYLLEIRFSDIVATLNFFKTRTQKISISYLLSKYLRYCRTEFSVICISIRLGYLAAMFVRTNSSGCV